jgi:hypothetical protein
MKRIYIILFAALLPILIISCEDLPPDTYDPKNYVEGYLIVDRPIEDIKLLRTQPLTDTLNYEKFFIRDAEVFISFKNQKIKLVIDAIGEKGYYYPDTTLKVLPETKYNLEIILKDGTIITSSTLTPKRFNWIDQPPAELQFPTDTIDFTDAQDTIKMKWVKNSFIPYSFIRIICLDTAQYGIYRTPQTLDSNRRVYREPTNRPNPRYNNRTLWGFVPFDSAPVIWTSFKWYGLHKISILSPDFNFMRYSLQYFRESQYNPLFSNIENGIGIFGSAAEVDAYSFVLFPK